MSAAIVAASANVLLKPAPINPDWILSGKPQACNRELSHSADWGAWTMVWDCTPGKFEWHYDIEETVHFIEGSVKIEAEGMPARVYGPGDVIFFAAGSKATWEIETYIRKVAFCRKTLPASVLLLQKIHARMRKLVSRDSMQIGALTPAA